MLDVQGLSVRFATSAGPAQAVSDLSFALASGERLGLVGESGSGKSTTALALLRLIRPPGRIVAGRILLDGEDVLAADARGLRALRFARIALVPQGAMNALNPVLTCGRQVEDVLEAHGTKPAGRVAALLESVGLRPDVADLYPHQLSGGMRQRVCIAMAVALGPSVIVADEPTSALDVIVQKQVLRTLIVAQKALGAGVILVGHDVAVMAQFAHTVGVMYAGRLVEIGSVRQVFAAPAHPYTRALIASVPRFGRRHHFVGLPGTAPSLVAPPPGCPFHPRCERAEPRCAVEAPPERALGDGRRVRCHFAGEIAGAA